MRIVKEESEFLSALESAKRESLRSFGDDAILLERYIAKPRHVEVNLFYSLKMVHFYKGISLFITTSVKYILV